MKFECLRSELSAALGLVCGVVPKRASKPVLQNIEFKPIGNDSMLLSGTDNEIGMSYKLSVSNMLDGETVLINAHTIAGLISEIKSDIIKFDINKKTAKLITENGKFKLPVAEDSEFPEIKNIGDKNIIEIPAAALIDAINKTAFATARGDTRYALNGICVNIEGEKVDFVASDTHRLSLVSKKIKNANNISGQSIVITKGMQDLARLAGGEEVVKFQLLSNELIAATSNATLISRLVDGQFPRYNDVVPKEDNITIEFDKNELIHSLRLVGKLSNDESHSVKIVSDTNKLIISAETGLRGRGNQTIDAEISGENIDISFNFLYLVDALKSINANKIKMILKNNSAPIKLVEGDYTHIVMPITAR